MQDMRHVSRLLIGVLFLSSVCVTAQQSRFGIEAAWTYVPGGLVVVPPLLGPNDDVYLLCEDRYVYRVNSDGELVFRANLMRKPVHGAVASDGSVIAALETGEVVAVSPAGRILFRTQRRYEAPWAPLVGLEGLIHVAYPSGRLEVRNRGGRMLWSAEVVDGISSPPVSVGGVTLIGTRGGRLVALDRFGASLWEAWLGTEATALAASGDNRVFVGTAEGRILAVGISGTTYWEIFTDAAVTDMRVGTDEVVYATEAGEVGRISFGGRILQKDSLAEPPLDILLTSEGVLVLEASGRLRNLDGSSVLVRQLEEQSVRVLAVGNDGSLIVAISTWEVGRYEWEVQLVGPWPVRGGRPARGRMSETYRVIDKPRLRYGESLNYLYLRDLALSPFAAEIDQALEEMLDDARDSRIRGKHGYYRDITVRLLEQSFTRVSRGAGSLSLPQEQRRKAVELLGLLGDDGSRAILLEYSRYESDPGVLAQYLHSFAMVGFDPDGALLSRTGEILPTELDPAGISSALARSALAALEALGRYNGRTPEWQEQVLRIVRAPLPNRITQSAARLLQDSD